MVGIMYFILFVSNFCVIDCLNYLFMFFVYGSSIVMCFIVFVVLFVSFVGGVFGRKRAKRIKCDFFGNVFVNGFIKVVFWCMMLLL